METKIGSYVCSGCDIDQALDVEGMLKVAEKEFKIPINKTHPFLCSEEGVKLLKDDRDQEGVNRFMIAACSKRQHEKTFDMGEESLVVRAPIREYVAWVQEKREEDGNVNEDTQMAGEDYVRMHCSQIKKSDLPIPFEQETSRSLLVIGGGITGMTAALEAAKAGNKVNLVEIKEQLGGYVLDQYKLIPSSPPYHSPQQNNIEELINLVEKHDGISVHKSTHVTSISGQPGEFKIQLSKNGKSVNLESGAVILATGSKPYDATKLTHLGIQYTNVISSIEFEQMAREKNIKRIDGKPAKNIAFIQCAGSRDPNHLPYCSSTCCMDSLKHASYIREQDPDAKAYILYRDMRTPGLYENFYRKQQDDPGIFLTKGDVTSVTEKGDGSIGVELKNTLFGESVSLEMDMVVLALGQESSTLDGESALNLQYRQGPDLPELKYGYPDSHFICFPYETRRTGIYAAGSVRQPLDMNDCIIDASGAALKAIQAIELSSKGRTVHPRVGDQTYPIFALDRCTACKRCTVECPFGVLDENERGVPFENPARCRSCGICMGACPVRVITFPDYSPMIFKEMMESIEMPDEFDEKPRILVFVCENDALPVFDMAALNRIKISNSIRIIPMRCLGGVNLVNVSDAMSVGYDGIMFMGCKYGDDYQCHFSQGSELCNTRLSKVQETIGRLGLEPERIKQFEISMNDFVQLPKIIKDFQEEIDELGPNPFKGM
ncbi:MAG: heterodisulfide reductase subunit A [Deltaproteobacteria bacterium]|nr:heterodisulfide reductase subunit A [Deltaproteobacteria bacterium]